MLRTEREALVRMRDEGRLDDEVRRGLLADLDLEEVLRQEQPPEQEGGEQDGS